MAKGDAVLRSLAEEVGDESAGAVVAVGGRSAFEIGGAVDGSAREVRAPAGVVDHQPAEMIVRVRAGTTVADLAAAVAESGQRVRLPVRAPASTVGGVLAVGGAAIRDVLLEVTFVLANGRLAKAGGPVVKNVTGFDLCRLLVGSLGTVAILGEVVLRTTPVPAASQWFRVPDPRLVWKPAAIVGDAVLLEGHPDDLAAYGFEPCAAPAAPPLVTPPVPVVEPAVRALHERIKHEFDPTGRLAPGRRSVA
jgi:FAD/FMN-containing dehydrogenase